LADNVQVTTAADGDVSSVPTGTTFATDDVGGVHYQRVKLDVGADGAASAVGSSGLPVNDASGSLTVDAPVATPVFVRLSDGASAIATLPVSIASVPSHAVTGPLTDAELRATAVPVSLSTVATTNAGTFAVQESGAALTALQLIDDAVYTDGTGTPSKALGIAGTDGTNPQIIKTDAAGELQVDVLSSALPSGAATEAKQDTGNTALSAIQTAVQLIDNAVSGSELQVDVVAALPAGTNNIGDVDVLTLPALPAGTNNIGDVDVLSLPAIPTGTNTIGVVIDERVSTSTVTSVNDTASSTQLLASTAGRKAAFFFNDSTAIAYLKLGTTATTSDFTVKMAAGGFYELPQPVYTGRIDCIWASDASGAMRITELS
jgi:hypothetical protein